MSAVLQTYGRADVAFERGEGAYLYATDGRRYLDFTSGIAVTSLGHCHPHLVEAIQWQAATLMHTSNLFVIPGQERMAERLAAATFADLVFFGNSGAEANEAAIKMARRYQHSRGRPERFRIVTFTNAFHGRTLATIAATGQEKILHGFGPKVDGFDTVEIENREALAAAVGDATAAIMIEPVQGEGGIRPVADDFLAHLREVCDRDDLLLIFDEVQCGMGRTGRLLGHEWSGVTPDVATLAKGIGGGFPFGCCIATEKAASGMTKGSHGSTFGGTPLAMAAGNAVLDVILSDGFLAHVEAIGGLLRSRVEQLCRRNDQVFDSVHGRGLMLGVRCRKPNGDVVDAARRHGLLLVAAGDNQVRLLPPLTIDESHVDEVVGILARVSEEMVA